MKRIWRSIPVLGFLLSEWQVWRTEQRAPRYRLATLENADPERPAYPIDMWPLLTLPHGRLDEAGIPYNAATKQFPAAYHPTTIAQFGLVNWNTYLSTQEESYKEAFLRQARWLMEHEVRLSNGAGGWPMPFSEPHFHAQAPWLSALTQGNGISVLVRASRLTGEESFLETARRAIHSFELEIREGGVSTTIGNDGIFFEEVAAYPAAQILNGYIFALFSLYDYIEATHDQRIQELVEHSLATLHTLIDRYDTGYWSYYDLLYKNPASHFYHDQHCILLRALATYTGCEHCLDLAKKWEGYMQNPVTYMRYGIASRAARYRRGVEKLIKSARKPQVADISENPVVRLM